MVACPTRDWGLYFANCVAGDLRPLVWPTPPSDYEEDRDDCPMYEAEIEFDANGEWHWKEGNWGHSGYRTD